MASLQVHLVTPEREAWTGPASFLVARGLEGDVGVLPGHAPLLAALAVGQVLIDRADGAGRLAVAVDGGFLHVGEPDGDGVTRVDVLAEHAVLQQEVEQADIDERERLAEALRRRGQHAEARGEIAKALTRRRIAGRG